MLINLSNALMAGKKLPYDNEVEYLESTGTQWIDTGLTFDVSSVVDIAIGITPTATSSGDAFFYGLENLGSGNIGLELYRTYFYFAAGTLEQNAGAATVGTRYDFLAHYESGNSWLKTNGTTTATLSNAFTKISSKTLFLFSRNTPSNPASAKIYSFKVYKNNVLIRDFIPVRVGTVGYLYDRVSGKLFGNAGTGAFGYGNDLKYPIPAEQPT